MKQEPEVGTALRVREVPVGKEAEQVEPQAIPEGVEVTVPEAGVGLVRVRVAVGAGTAILPVCLRS
jgi:hypothetical protein